MTRIDHLSRIFGVVKQELQTAKIKNNKTEKKAHTKSHAENLEEFSQILAERIEKIEKRDFQSTTSAFVTSILAWEFGYHILDDSEHEKLTNRIVSALESDPQTRQAIQKILNTNA